MLFPVNGNSDFDRAGTALPNGVNTKRNLVPQRLSKKQKLPLTKCKSIRVNKRISSWEGAIFLFKYLV